MAAEKILEPIHRPRAVLVLFQYDTLSHIQRARPGWGRALVFRAGASTAIERQRPRVSNSTTSTATPLIANPAKWNMRPDAKKSSMYQNPFCCEEHLTGIVRPTASPVDDARSPLREPRTFRLGCVEWNDDGVVLRCAPEQGFGSRLAICSLRPELRSSHTTLDLNRLASLPRTGPRKASPDRHEGDQIKRRWE
jgi:hypothetical protein